MNSPHPTNIPEETAPSSPVNLYTTADTEPQSVKQSAAVPKDLPFDQDASLSIVESPSEASNSTNLAPQHHNEERYLELTEPVKEHITSFRQFRQLLRMQEPAPQVVGEDEGSPYQDQQVLSHTNMRLFENAPVNQVTTAEAESEENNQEAETIADTLEDLRIDSNAPGGVRVPIQSMVVTTTKDHVRDESGYEAGDEDEWEDTDEDSEMHSPRGEDTECNIDKDEKEHGTGSSAVGHGTYARECDPIHSSEMEGYEESTIEAGELETREIDAAPDEADSVGVTSGTDNDPESPAIDPAGSPVDIVPIARYIHDEYNSDDESTEAEIFNIVFVSDREFELYPLNVPTTHQVAAREVWDAWKLRWLSLSAQIYKFKSHVAVEISYQKCQDLRMGAFPNPEITRNIFRSRTGEALNSLRYLCRTLFLMERLIPEEYKRQKFLMGKLTRQLDRRIEEAASVVGVVREAAELQTREAAKHAEQVVEVWAQDIEDRKWMMREAGLHIVPFRGENQNDDWFGELISSRRRMPR